MTDYYEALNGLWIKLDQYQNLKMECSKDTTTLAQFIERDRIFEFLAGLNPKYDPIRVQILGKEKLLSLSELFYIVRGEESRRVVMLDDKPTDGSALATSKATKLGPPLSFSKSGCWCTYCKKSGHTKENCFKLHGKDQVLSRTGGFRNINQGQAHLTTTEFDTVANASQVKDEIPTFSKEELERLQTLIDSFSKPSGSYSLAMNDKNLCSLSSHVFSDVSKDSWIIDSGAI